MDNNFDQLKNLLLTLRNLSFVRRLFFWHKVKESLIDATADLQRLLYSIEVTRENNSQLEQVNRNLTKDLQLSGDAMTQKLVLIESLNFQFKEKTDKVSQYTSELAAAKANMANLEKSLNQTMWDYRLLHEQQAQLLKENKQLREDQATIVQNNADYTKRKSELDIELAQLKSDYQNKLLDLQELRKQNTQLMKDEEFRKQEHSNALASLQRIQEQIQADRNKEVEERNIAEIDRIRQMKETWAKHQENVKNTIKSICNKQTIEYIDHVPFKGDPDNTVKICDEFVVFDAKSPANDDLSNFPHYLKDQAEKAKKYAKQENVKCDIFFVIPSSTLESLSTFVYPLADYTVYFISLDSLEPVLLCLQRIEAYEFAEQLSPEERENICRILGKFAHLSKRRIQIDSFFAKQFIELAYKCESDLPKDVMDKVVEFEKSEKLNPPLEKRVKAISIRELEKDRDEVNSIASTKGIVIEDAEISMSLNALPLYKRSSDTE
jgi:hypothetical protein